PSAQSQQCPVRGVSAGTGTPRAAMSLDTSGIPVFSGARAVHDTSSILGRIRRLADEALRLRLHCGDAGDNQRLIQVQVELYQYWDLLRQRRARREAGNLAPALRPA